MVRTKKWPTSRRGECVTDVLTTSWRSPCIYNWQTTAKCYLLVWYKKAFVRYLTWSWSIQNKARHWLFIILKYLWLACRGNGVSCTFVLQWITVLDQWKARMNSGSYIIANILAEYINLTFKRIINLKASSFLQGPEAFSNCFLVNYERTFKNYCSVIRKGRFQPPLPSLISTCEVFTN